MLLTFALGALCGVAVGRGRGGRLAGLTTLRFRAPILLAAAALIQAVVAVGTPAHRVAALGTAYLMVGSWLTINALHQRRGVRLGCVALGIGWLLNLLPIMLNGGMPVSGAALERIGAPKTMSVTEGHFNKHVPAGQDTRLTALGDVLPLSMANSIISIGDIVMMVGIALVLASGMTRVAERRPKSDGACDIGRPAR